IRAHGKVLVPIVVVRHLTALAVVRDRVDGVRLLSSADAFETENRAAEVHFNLELMTEAKRAAGTAASATLGDPTKRGDVTFQTGSLGGPSAGLAFALTLVDLSTPGGLLGGHTVAATGAISNDGTVGTV